MEAQAANRNGVFIIGNESKINDYFVQTTLADIIKLKVSLPDSIKEYSYEEIKDLQNRLMLLGSSTNNKTSIEKQKEKDYFVEVRVFFWIILFFFHFFLKLCLSGVNSRPIYFLQFQLVNCPHNIYLFIILTYLDILITIILI